MKVLMLIDDGMKSNESEIKEICSRMEQQELMFIYQERKMKTTVPFVCNLLAGFGSGSFIQGDAVGGVIGLTGGLIGLSIFFHDPNDISSNKSFRTRLYILLGSYFYCLLRPFSFSYSYNKNLKSLIGFDDKATINIHPNIDVTKDGVVAPGVALTIAF